MGIGHLPEGRTAPRNATPRELLPEQVLVEVVEKIGVMDGVIARAEEKYGQRTRLLDHPILGPLQGREWRKFHWVHGQHHITMRALRAKFTPSILSSLLRGGYLFEPLSPAANSGVIAFHRHAPEGFTFSLHCCDCSHSKLQFDTVRRGSLP